ncbi:MAG: imidazole glycerol phosphate synthase subunit HisF, partial [Proteobacteria bacterium]|nr:imidazole glycerol phosphate synthase subunit HisF [Pseudomonadota bacterium]
KHFVDVFKETNSSGALAASVFHKNILNINELKGFLKDQSINTRY